MLERSDDILAEPWRENIFLCPKLVSGLSDNGVDDVQPRDFVFWFALSTQKQRTGVKISHNSETIYEMTVFIHQLNNTLIKNAPI